jgi:ribonuclease HI
VKLSVDGSFSAANRMAGAGMVLRDADDFPIFTVSRPLDDCQAPLEAELRARVEGLVLAFQHFQLPILVESDCS